MTYRQGDYVLQQSDYNNHYMIIRDNGRDEPRMVMHCQCTKRLTEAEAKEHLDFYLNRLPDIQTMIEEESEAKEG